MATHVDVLQGGTDLSEHVTLEAGLLPSVSALRRYQFGTELVAPGQRHGLFQSPSLKTVGVQVGVASLSQYIL
jgi:hypothetical protein